MEKLFNLLERFVNAVEKIAEAGNAPVAQIPVVTQFSAEPETQVTTSASPKIPADLSKLTIEALRRLPKANPKRGDGTISPDLRSLIQNPLWPPRNSLTTLPEPRRVNEDLQKNRQDFKEANKHNLYYKKEK